MKRSQRKLPIIPEGWRAFRTNEAIQSNDKWWINDSFFDILEESTAYKMFNVGSPSNFGLVPSEKALPFFITQRP